MRKIAYITLLAGLVLFLYPTVNQWVQDYKQAKALEQWEHSQQSGQGTDHNLQQQYQQVNQLLTSEPEPDDDLPAAEPAGKTIATIHIDKINLKLPVLEGVNEANLKYAAAHLTETTPLGEIGNAAIAAHRARTKGRLFNRLNELEIGDEILIQQSNSKLAYKVYQISIVEPTDVSVLNRNNKDRILTLITCDPVINATHRLIIHAKLIETL